MKAKRRMKVVFWSLCIIQAISLSAFAGPKLRQAILNWENFSKEQSTTSTIEELLQKIQETQETQNRIVFDIYMAALEEWTAPDFKTNHSYWKNELKKMTDGKMLLAIVEGIYEKGLSVLAKDVLGSILNSGDRVAEVIGTAVGENAADNILVHRLFRLLKSPFLARSAFGSAKQNSSILYSALSSVGKALSTQRGEALHKGVQNILSITQDSPKLQETFLSRLGNSNNYEALEILKNLMRNANSPTETLLGAVRGYQAYQKDADSTKITRDLALRTNGDIPLVIAALEVLISNLNHNFQNSESSQAILEIKNRYSQNEQVYFKILNSSASSLNSVKTQTILEVLKTSDAAFSDIRYIAMEAAQHNDTILEHPEFPDLLKLRSLDDSNLENRSLAEKIVRTLPALKERHAKIRAFQCKKFFD